MTNPELLRRLKELGVITTTAHYDGYGDSGSVESVEARDKDSKEVKLPEDVRKAIEEAAECYLSNHGIDWYNNEGGFGDYILDVAARTQKLEHSERISDTEYSEHEDELDLTEGGEAPEVGAVEESTPVCACPTLINGHHAGCPFAAKGGA